jgi:hypothetical protein
MNSWWSYFWPAFAAGIVIGTITGVIAFRRSRVPSDDDEGGNSSRSRPRRKRWLTLFVGALCTIGATALWHGPFGGAARFSSRVERDLHDVLVHYEMTQVTAHLHHDPLTRRVLLSGPADDFQHSELVRLIDQLPGVSSTSWSSGGGVPLIVEGAAVALLGFLLGLLLAYLLELRRRYNAQWNW